MAVGFPEGPSTPGTPLQNSALVLLTSLHCMKPTQVFYIFLTLMWCFSHPLKAASAAPVPVLNASVRSPVTSVNSTNSVQSYDKFSLQLLNSNIHQVWLIVGFTKSFIYRSYTDFGTTRTYVNIFGSILGTGKWFRT